jgi:hypothetical protein
MTTVSRRFHTRVFDAADRAAIDTLLDTFDLRTPNVSKERLVAFLDQLACYGNSFYETPAIDALAGHGMRFTHAYAAAPVCSPTRASLMTGKYPARLHITDYLPGSPFPFDRLKTPVMTMGLPLQEETIPEILGRAGYVSGHFGKWHLNKDKKYSPGRPGDPRSQGFSDVLTTKKPTDLEGARITRALARRHAHLSLRRGGFARGSVWGRGVRHVPQDNVPEPRRPAIGGVGEVGRYAPSSGVCLGSRRDTIVESLTPAETKD